MIGILKLHIRFPGCKSLKEKRSLLKPLKTRLHREFNVSVAEMGYQDKRSETVIACAMIGNDTAHLQRSLSVVLKWIESHFPMGQVYDNSFEYFS
ncbi:DUF503 domain-containing protein [Chloroflexota bacterium]